MPTGPVVVVGAGPAGLATAAALARAGRPVRLLERADRVGAAWAARYDSLHLHTVRWLSGLPGLRIPREYGRWVARDDLVRYLAAYAAAHGLTPELGVAVTRVDVDGGGWVVRTDVGDRPASRVVVATGYSHTPRRPDWPGVDTFTGDLRHSADYREPSAYAGKRVLVVGAGNSATEIALDLLGAGARVQLSVRTPPGIVRRETFGVVPSQVFGIAMKKVPDVLKDPLAAAMRKVSVPDLSAQGLPAASNPYTQFRKTGTVPILDTGIVDAVRSGRVEVVAATVAVDGPTVHLADGSALRPDAVVAATGFTTGLEPVVGHLGVLDDDGVPLVHGADDLPTARGLHFVGIKAELSGLLREIGLEARSVGRTLAGR